MAKKHKNTVDVNNPPVKEIVEQVGSLCHITQYAIDNKPDRALEIAESEYKQFSEYKDELQHALDSVNDVLESFSAHIFCAYKKRVEDVTDKMPSVVRMHVFESLLADEKEHAELCATHAHNKDPKEGEGEFPF
jgi:hypothetical protein